MLKRYARKCIFCSRTRVFLAWAVVIAAGVTAFGQQSQREHIYMSGKAVAVEASAFSAPAISLTAPTTGTSYTSPSNAVSLSGAASDASGISGVTWVSNRGGLPWYYCMTQCGCSP